MLIWAQDNSNLVTASFLPYYNYQAWQQIIVLLVSTTAAYFLAYLFSLSSSPAFADIEEVSKLQFLIKPVIRSLKVKIALSQLLIKKVRLSL